MFISTARMRSRQFGQMYYSDSSKKVGLKFRMGVKHVIFFRSKDEELPKKMLDVA